MELIKVVNAKNTLEGFSNNTNISSKLAYWMTKFIVKAQPECDFYVSELRKIVDKYECEQRDGNLIVPGDKVDEFNEDVRNLESTDVEAPNIRFALSDISSLKMSMRQMYPLLDFIDEHE